MTLSGVYGSREMTSSVILGMRISVSDLMMADGHAKIWRSS